jgi:hypothetical protein
VICLPVFVAPMLMVLSRSVLPFLHGIAGDAATLLIEVLFRLAVTALATALLLYLERDVAGRHPDSR